MLDVADRQDADRVGGVDQDVMDHLGRDGEAVERENLHITEEIEAAEAGENTTQRARVKAVASKSVSEA